MSKKGRQIGGVIGILVIFGLVAGGIVVQRQTSSTRSKNRTTTSQD